MDIHRIGRWLLIGALAPSWVPAQTPVPLRPGPPSWAADAVWYLVIPDRFRNGDPRNDPVPNDLRGAAPAEPLRAWHVSPWTSDWYRLQPWETGDDRDFYWHALTRRYGGDLSGVIERLDYIQSLGVNTVLLTPVFEAPSALKLDPTLLHHVDNNFGPDPDGDRLIAATENPADPTTWKWTAADRLLLRLIQEAHRREMRVVLDLVAGHVGQTFWAFRDVRTKGADSRYASWFLIKRYDDPKTAVDELEYQCRDGQRELPEIRREGDTLARGPRDYLRAVVTRFGDPNGDGDPNDGVDGWRLEAADRLPLGFLRELRRTVLGVNPDAILAGDLGWEDFDAQRMYDPAKWLRGDALDTIRNDRWAQAARSFFLDRGQTIPATELDSRLAALRTHSSSIAALNALDTPDTDRIASQAVNPDRPYDHLSGPPHDPRYDVRAPKADEWKRVRLAAIFQFASLGSPLVYYGTEAGMWGADDPDSRKPMVWTDMRYEPETLLPGGQKRRADPVRVDEAMFTLYQILGRARGSQAALRRGGFELLLADDERRIFAFARVLDAERVVCAFNGSERDATVELALGSASRDLVSGRRFRPKDGRTSVPLPALSAVLLSPERGED